MSNPNLQKIIKLTQAQYDTLSNGGTVGDYTGLNDNYLYLIQDDTEYITDVKVNNTSIVSSGVANVTSIPWSIVSDKPTIPTNIENGTGTNAVRQKMADATVNFTGRNPNAEALDSSLSATLNTGASGSQSAAFGKNTMALSATSLTSGNKTVAKGEESHAEGYQSVTLGNGSHAEGEATVSYGEVSHSEGSNTQSLGTASHAEGVRSKTLIISGVTDSGNAAHAEGESTIAAGYGSHTEGFGSYTGPIASAPSYPVTPEPEPSPTPSPTPVIFYGNMAHAEGNYCFAIGTGSHAEGYHTQALHEAAHASGVGTKTYRSGQFVTGWYNATPSSDDLFVIGNGTADNARSNIFVVSLDGKVTAPTFVGNLNGNATSATSAVSANSASTASIAQQANLVHVNPDSSYVGAILVNSNNNQNTIVRKDNITVTQDGRLTVAHDPTDNMDVATKQYVDNNNTKNTAGSTNDTSLLYLIGAKTQAANPQTYSRNNTYINANGVLVNTAGFSSQSTGRSDYASINIGTNVVNYYSGSGPASFKATSGTHGSWQIGDNSGNIYLQKTGISGPSSGNAYLLFPNVGLSSGPKTLATTDDLAHSAVAVIQTPTKNLNGIQPGSVMSNYQSGVYPYYLIRIYADGVTRQMTYSEVKHYMEVMTGTSTVPKYVVNSGMMSLLAYPQSDGTLKLLKPQWEGTATSEDDPEQAEFRLYEMSLAIPSTAYLAAAYAAKSELTQIIDLRS